MRICRTPQSLPPLPHIPLCLNSSCSTGITFCHFAPESFSGFWYFFLLSHSKSSPLFFWYGTWQAVTYHVPCASIQNSRCDLYFAPTFGKPSTVRYYPQRCLPLSVNLSTLARFHRQLPLERKTGLPPAPPAAIGFRLHPAGVLQLNYSRIREAPQDSNPHLLLK